MAGVAFVPRTRGGTSTSTESISSMYSKAEREPASRRMSRRRSAESPGSAIVHSWPRPHMTYISVEDEDADVVAGARRRRLHHKALGLDRSPLDSDGRWVEYVTGASALPLGSR